MKTYRQTAWYFLCIYNVYLLYEYIPLFGTGNNGFNGHIYGQNYLGNLIYYSVVLILD